MTDMAALLQEGLEHHRGGRLQQAAALYLRALERQPAHAEANHLMGLVDHQAGRRDDAIRRLSAAAAADPGNATYHSNLGVALQSLGRLQEASECYERAMALDPEIAAIHNNQGVVLHGLGRLVAAEQAHRRAIAIEPRYAEAHANLGLTLLALERYEEAAASSRAALSLRPRYAKALGNLGNAQRRLGQAENAIASYRAALAVASSAKEGAAIQYALGIALFEVHRYEEAAAAFLRAVELDPEDSKARPSLWLARSQGCDWRDRPQMLQEIATHVESFDDRSGESAGPFTLLALTDDPALHRTIAARWAQVLAARVAGDAGGPIVRRPPRPDDGKIRLAYLSADFHEHATAYLAAEMFELHDRDRFEIHAISFGPPDNSPMRKRLQAAFASFREMSDAPSREIAQAVADLGIDIAIDLKGYTRHARTDVFAYRPAPIQVQYLGFPGTMGADFIDYVIADPIVIPEEEQRHYAERIAYLPHSYQVNDRRRPLPASPPSRAACGLPDDGFVFANFNASYKITPEIFSIWMRLLREVEGSVLWLFEGNSWARQNLSAEAEARGVDPQRLVFAGRLPQAPHLARVGNADLFLDNLPYNAHTTASDALWVGLPVLTTPGRSFASRVGASLLTAIGVPELIAPTLPAYEAMALELARAPERLAGLRRKLIGNRQTAPLFDTPAFTRNIEAAYAQMWRRHQSGSPPETFRTDAR